MSAVFRGSAIVFHSQEQDWHPTAGYTTRQTYKGRNTEIYALAASYRALGWATNISQDGPVHILAATLGGSAEEVETPDEQWGWNTEQITKDVFSHPAVAAEAALFAKPAKYKNDIENAVAQGIALAGDVSTLPLAPLVYRELTRGVTGYEVEYFTLSRVRNYSPNYPLRVQIDAVSKLYTTAQLIATFNLPSIVQNALPDTPDISAVGAIWAWRRRDFSAEYDGAGRITERTTWAHSNWSALLYQPVP